ncbi:hypothetical protein RUMOBE_03630 [Blautia obeum ATCC 29174]|uniref:Uncharacterized protein n=1 Tax=Blautia obeum ATCC 29174 TaxID=411459 RepID=A5ZX78_9FIRM|nr:hypothetical protein RUMOBE_03630 [Blautia obeum ATCC 29174]
MRETPGRIFVNVPLYLAQFITSEISGYTELC